MPHAPHYIGRFAPSPSGPLHFGSLVAALASYLDARHCNGQWLVRMEDLDPPREQPGAADTILRQLESHQLAWDGPVLYQSSRHDAYQHALERLSQLELTYPCDCTRQQLKAMGGQYDGRCRHRTEPPQGAVAWRLRCDRPEAHVRFKDLWQGPQDWSLESQGGDFVVRRKDGLYAYQLGCGLDDMDQGITHVIRGSDLLDSSPRQSYLIQLLGGTPPQYGHIPVAIKPDGQKLSKQNLSPAISDKDAASNLRQALAWLHHPAPDELADADCGELLEWAVAHWDRRRLPSQMSLPAPEAFL